jgi:hypothetical protein
MWPARALGWAMWRLLRGRGWVCLPWPWSSPSPWVGRGGDRRLRPGLSSSLGVGRGRVRRLSGLSPSLSPGSGGAEFAVFRGLARVRALGRAEWSSSSSGAEPKSEPWVGRSGVRRLPRLSPSPSPGSGGAEFAVFRGLARVRALGRTKRSFLWCLRPGLTACQPHSVKWHCSRCGAGGAVFLSGRSVERRSDGGHFGSVNWRARVRIKVSGHLCIKFSCDLVGRRDDLVRVASWRRQGLERAGSMFVAGGGPRARRRSSGVGYPCPRLGSGEARSSPSNGPIPDSIAPIRPLQLCADGCYQLRIRSLEGTPNYGPRQYYMVQK